MAATSEPHLISAETRTQASPYFIEWTVHNFLYPISNPVDSPCFSLGEGVDCRFHLKYHVFSNQEVVSTSVTVHYRCPGKVCYIDRKGFHNSNHEVKEDWSAQPPLRMEGGETVQFGTNLHLSLISKRKAENIPDSSLTFYCYITVVEELVAPLNKNVLLHNMATDFEKELYNSKSSDVTLEVEDERIPAHKAVLSARSPVFAAMFDSGMSEQISGHVRISDIKKEAVKELLRFLYCCRVDRLHDMAYDLLPAADKYCLPDLKDMCERTLVNQIKVENVFIYLELANSHQCDELRKAAIRYIKANPKEVMSCGADVFRTHAYLLAEVFEELVGVTS